MNCRASTGQPDLGVFHPIVEAKSPDCSAPAKRWLPRRHPEDWLLEARVAGYASDAAVRDWPPGWAPPPCLDLWRHRRARARMFPGRVCRDWPPRWVVPPPPGRLPGWEARATAPRKPARPGTPSRLQRRHNGSGAWRALPVAWFAVPTRQATLRCTAFLRPFDGKLQHADLEWELLVNQMFLSGPDVTR
jgi:hypothetical protein